MSKIEELIAQYCPEGAEWKSFSDVCQFFRGITYSKKDETTSGESICVLRANNVTLASNTLNFKDVKTVAKTVKVKDYQWLKKDDILICAASGSKDHIGKVAYIHEDINYTYGGFMGKIVASENVLSRYVFHILTSRMFSYYLESALNTTTINNLNSQILKNFKIPIPPLPVQEEIVRILDKFTALEAELEAELEARTRQYEYYRNQLLAFEGEDVEWKALGDVANYSKNRIAANEINLDSYVGVDNLLQNKRGKTFSSYVPTAGNLTQFIDDDILIGNIRPYLKKIWKSNITGGTNGDVLVIRISNEYKGKLISDYLYYLLSSDGFFDYNMQYAKGAKMPRGDKDSILKYRIPIPPLSEQDRIVAILDKFDALVNDISVGLPAEIQARKQQYEYYRGKLLTF